MDQKWNYLVLAPFGGSGPVENGRQLWQLPDGIAVFVVEVEFALWVEGRKPVEVLDVVQVGDQARGLVVYLRVSRRSVDV